MVPWRDSPWEFLGESSGGIPQADCLGGTPGGEGTGGEGRGGEECQGDVPAE